MDKENQNIIIVEDVNSVTINVKCSDGKNRDFSFLDISDPEINLESELKEVIRKNTIVKNTVVKKAKISFSYKGAVIYDT